MLSTYLFWHSELLVNQNYRLLCSCWYLWMFSQLIQIFWCETFLLLYNSLLAVVFYLVFNAKLFVMGNNKTQL
jgi:hypothetical protein